jgi:hypothetical protein
VTITDIAHRDKATAVAHRAKSAFACCVAHADERGRLPIGYCSAECERRLQPHPVVQDVADVAVALAEPLLPWGVCS